MKAWHDSCWTKTSTLRMCGNTDSLFFSISAEGMAPSGMQLRTEKDTVACETEPLFIIGTNQRRNLHCPWYLYWISTLKTGGVIHICLQD